MQVNGVAAQLLNKSVVSTQIQQRNPQADFMAAEKAGGNTLLMRQEKKRLPLIMPSSP